MSERLKFILVLLLNTFALYGGRNALFYESSTPSDTLKNLLWYRDHKTLLVIKEQNLASDTTLKQETRFYFHQTTGNIREFYKINYDDSTLIFKMFTQASPKEIGKDSIYLTKIIKLSAHNIKTIAVLLDKSKFWSRNTLTESNYSPFDGDHYKYESVRIENSETDKKRHYHSVISYAPTNQDFINFGQYLRSLAGQKNTFKD